jgi:hypothetical protein
VLLHAGPDVGTVYATDVPLLVASSSLANHDALASSILVHLNAVTTQTYVGLYAYNRNGAAGANSIFANGFGVEIGAAGPWVSGSSNSTYTAHPFEDGITRDAATVRGWELAGGQPSTIPVVVDGEPLDAALQTGIETHGEGIYAFS